MSGKHSLSLRDSTSDVRASQPAEHEAGRVGAARGHHAGLSLPTDERQAAFRIRNALRSGGLPNVTSSRPGHPGGSG